MNPSSCDGPGVGNGVCHHVRKYPVQVGYVLPSDDKTLQVVLGRLLIKEGIRVAEGHPDGRRLRIFFLKTPDEFLEK